MEYPKVVLTTKENIKAIFRGFNVVKDISQLPKTKSIVVMISFPTIIGEELLKKHIFLNVHNSLLPKYRGMHSFAWAMINGEKKTGYTLYRVTKGIDDGPIIDQIVIPINHNDDINDLFKKGDIMLKKWALHAIKRLTINDILSAHPQNQMFASYYKKRKAKDGRIRWDNNKNTLYNFIRALKPPYTQGAYTFSGRKKLVICQIKPLPSKKAEKSIPGKIVFFDKRGILVSCRDGLVLICEIFINGKFMNPFLAMKNFKGDFLN